LPEAVVGSARQARRPLAYSRSMDTNPTKTQATLEDRIYVLELALSSIGGALLAPHGWGDTGELHQEIYATVRRVLRGSDFMDLLERREAQLDARESSQARAATDVVMNALHKQVADSGEKVPQP
jgi:hypothetical protein